MKILIINSVCGNGSTGRIAADTYHVLKNAGHECRVAFGIGTSSNMPAEDTYKFNSRFGYYLHNALSRITDRAGFYSPIATRRLLRYIREYDPDVIQLHNLHGYYVNIKMLFQFLRKLGKPVIWTLHDCWALTGHCVHFALAGCRRWKEGCYRCPQKGTYPISLLCDRSKKNYRQKRQLFTGISDMQIITPCEWLAELTRMSYLSKYPIHVIHNGIDLSLFGPTSCDFREKSGLASKKIVLGVAGVWSDKKGLRDFVQLSELIESDCKLVLVGLSKEQISTLPPNIIGIEKTQNITELAGLYSTADVFVNLTREDNFPTVNLEALACGTPVITYATGGCPEAVDDSCGIVLHEKSPQAVLAALPQAMNLDPTACTKRAAECYNKEDRYLDYLNLYIAKDPQS